MCGGVALHRKMHFLAKTNSQRNFKLAFNPLFERELSETLSKFDGEVGKTYKKQMYSFVLHM
jgi:hypothetical protein